MWRTKTGGSWWISNSMGGGLKHTVKEIFVSEYIYLCQFNIVTDVPPEPGSSTRSTKMISPNLAILLSLLSQPLKHLHFPAGRPFCRRTWRILLEGRKGTGWLQGGSKRLILWWRLTLRQLDIFYVINCNQLSVFLVLHWFESESASEHYIILVSDNNCSEYIW